MTGERMNSNNCICYRSSERLCGSKRDGFVGVILKNWHNRCLLGHQHHKTTVIMMLFYTPWQSLNQRPDWFLLVWNRRTSWARMTFLRSPVTLLVSVLNSNLVFCI